RLELKLRGRTDGRWSASMRGGLGCFKLGLGRKQHPMLAVATVDPPLSWIDWRLPFALLVTNTTLMVRPATWTVGPCSLARLALYSTTSESDPCHLTATGKPDSRGATWYRSARIGCPLVA